MIGTTANMDARDSVPEQTTTPAPAAILFVHHAGLNWVRGATRCLLDHLRYIDRSRFQPIVWCNQPATIEAVTALGIPVHPAPYWNGAHPLRPEIGWMREAWKLIRTHRVRLIHADEFAQAAVLVPVARSARIPVLAQLHQVPPLDERLWSYLHQVDFVVGSTQACVAGLIDDGYPAGRTQVISNGVDPARLAAGDARRLRADLGIGERDVVITTVTSFLPHKAVDVTLRAFALLRERRDDCRVLICGDGPDRAALEAEARALNVTSSVFFLGDRTDVGAILRDATDVLLTTSRDESFGLTLAEAGVFGVPIVASAIPAHREVLGDGQAGVLVETGNATDAADALLRLANDPALRREYGERIRARVNEMFVIDRYVQTFRDTYTQLLAQPAGEFGWIHGTRWPRAYSAWVRRAIRRRVARLLPQSSRAQEEFL